MKRTADVMSQACRAGAVAYNSSAARFDFMWAAANSVRTNPGLTEPMRIAESCGTPPVKKRSAVVSLQQRQQQRGNSTSEQEEGESRWATQYKACHKVQPTAHQRHVVYRVLDCAARGGLPL